MNQKRDTYVIFFKYVIANFANLIHATRLLCNCNALMLSSKRGQSLLLSSGQDITCMDAAVFCFMLLWSSVYPHVPVQSNMKTFSYAIKDGQVEANQEKVLYKRQSGAGVVTLQWFASNIVGMNYEARIRIYVDKETNASIDYQLYLAHGIGSADSIEDTLVPWGTKRISHTAKGGGISNTYRIPFLKALKVTLTHPKGGTF